MAEGKAQPAFSLEIEHGVFHGQLKSMYENPQFSDLNINTASASINVHKIVMCMASEWFQTALTGRFKEGNANELALVEDDPDAIRAIVEFAYKFDYDVNDKHAPAVVFHAKVFAVAEKYLMPGLQKLAADRILSSASYMESSSLAEAISITYTQSLDRDEVIHPRLIGYVLAHPELLRDKVAHAEFHAMLDSIAVFAAGLTRVMAETWQKIQPTPIAVKQRYSCPACGIMEPFEAAIPAGSIYTHECGYSGAYTMTEQEWQSFRQR